MIETVSCGGVVIYRGKFLLLFMNYHNRYEGWVLPKGTVEAEETFEETAVREVREESGAKGTIVEFLGECNYDFRTPEGTVYKTVNWYLMSGENFYCKPQREEYFTDAGYYKYHEAYYLLKYDNERKMLELAHKRYLQMKKEGTWKEGRKK